MQYSVSKKIAQEPKLFLSNIERCLDNYPKGFDIDNFEDDLFMIERVPFTVFLPRNKDSCYSLDTCIQMMKPYLSPFSSL